MKARTLHALLSWAHAQYVGETPELQHAVSLTDEGGSPEMKPAAASYLGLQARKQLTDQDNLPDNWRALAGRKAEGKYLTPLRFAIELCPDPGERSFLRSLVPELYYPSEIAEIHGIPKWAAGYVMQGALVRLRERYERLVANSEKGTAAYVPPRVGWVSMSDSQRAAIEEGEKRGAQFHLPLDPDVAA